MRIVKTTDETRDRGLTRAGWTNERSELSRFDGEIDVTERGITIELDDSARELIIEDGYDPVYGARPLKRAIQSLIQNPLAVSLLNGDVASGQTVRVSAENGAMKFTPAESAQKTAKG